MALNSLNYRNLKRNYGYLLTANIIASLIGLASLAITARMLSTSNFGLLMLVQSYVMVAGQLVSFRTWQPVIKYGIDFLNRNDDVNFVSLIKIAFKVDVVTASLGFLVAVGLARPMFAVMEWDLDAYNMLFIYSFTILLNLSGPGMGILRIFNRFDLIAFQQIGFQLIRCSLLIVCWLNNYGILTIVYAWVVSEILAYLILVIFGIHEMRNQGFRLLTRTPELAGRNEFFRFLVANNFDSSIRAVSRHADVLLIGFFAGQAQAGIYKLAVQLSNIITRFTDPLYHLLLPEFSNLVANNKIQKLKDKMKRITLTGACFFIASYMVILLIGDSVIYYVFGPSYMAAYGIMSIYLLAIGLAVTFVTIVPFFHAIGMPQICLKVQTLATISYGLILVPLVYYMNATGGAIAYILYHLFWFKLIWPRMKEQLG